MRTTISALGSYVPPTILSNEFFSERLNTSDEWIVSKTGIRTRHVALEGATSDLIIPAAWQCLNVRGLHPSDIDCILVATITPDKFFPSTAAIVQKKLGAVHAWGFDLSAACSGFIYGLVVADSLIKSGAAQRVLVCGADKMSSITNYDDRRTAILFGDAAGVALVEQCANQHAGIVDSICRVEGQDETDVHIPAGGSFQPATLESVAQKGHFLAMNGSKVAINGVQGMVQITKDLLKRNSLNPSQVDWFIPHQSNLRMIEKYAEEIGAPAEKVTVNIDQYGNTSAATIPLCMAEWQQKQRFKEGNSLILCSVGSGYTFASLYLIW